MQRPRGRFQSTFLALGFCAFLACGGKAQTSGDGDGDEATGDGDGDEATGDGDGDEAGRSCESALDCALVNEGCCSPCGEQSILDVVAIPADEMSTYQAVVCQGDISCPDCLTTRNPRLYADCVAGACVALDLATSADTECAAPSDCTLLPNACCGCNASRDVDQMVAINSSRATAFQQSKCAALGMGEPVDCYSCDWIPPDGWAPDCVNEHCVFVPVR